MLWHSKQRSSCYPSPRALWDGNECFEIFMVKGPSASGYGMDVLLHEEPGPVLIWFFKQVQIAVICVERLLEVLRNVDVSLFRHDTPLCRESFNRQDSVQFCPTEVRKLGVFMDYWRNKIWPSLVDYLLSCWGWCGLRRVRQLWKVIYLPFRYGWGAGLRGVHKYTIFEAEQERCNVTRAVIAGEKCKAHYHVIPETGGSMFSRYHEFPMHCWPGEKLYSHRTEYDFVDKTADNWPFEAMWGRVWYGNFVQFVRRVLAYAL